ncbi:hypothetical protein NQD34_004855, partial [Periophthalmus magnuspinnatus]
MNIILFVLFTAGFREGLCFHEVYRKYFYINELKNWTDAQEYCRQHYSDLATFTSMEEINRLNRPFTDYAWIGLFDDTASWKGIMGNESNSWRWSATGTTSPGGYQKWERSEPNNADGQSYCAKMQSGVWGDVNCENKYYFVCFNAAESHPKQYFSVSIALTWKDARSYCRQHYTDLAMIKDETENTVVASFYPTGPYWIGLYREGWRWSHGTNSTFTNWLTGQPNNAGAIQYCVQEDNTHKWNDWPCHSLQYFLCHKCKSFIIPNN